MAIDTIAGLRDAVLRWAGESSDPKIQDAITDSIMLCESELNRGFLDPSTSAAVTGLRVPEMVARALLTADKEFEVLPPEFLELKSAAAVVGEQEYPLRPVPEDGVGFYRQGRFDRGDDTDRTGFRSGGSHPWGYVLQGSQIRLVPVTSSGQVIRLVYYIEVPSLLSSSPTLAVLRKYPLVYLYGTLRHLAAYQVDDAQIGKWTGMFVSAIRGANRASRDR